jgi:hypothetical protein
MTTKLVQGSPEELKEVVDRLLADGKEIHNVICLSLKSYYLVIHSL